MRVGSSALDLFGGVNVSVFGVAPGMGTRARVPQTTPVVGWPLSPAARGGAASAVALRCVIHRG